MNLEILADAAATALIRVAGTDAGQSADAAIAELYRRLPSRQGEPSAAWLRDLPELVLAARRSGDVSAERELEAACAAHLRQLLFADSAMPGELRRVVREVLLPALSAGDRSRIDARLAQADIDSGPVADRGGRRRIRGRSPFESVLGVTTDRGSPASWMPEAPRPGRQLISTGFSLRAEPASAIGPDHTLITGMPYLYWFEISGRVPHDSIEVFSASMSRTFAA
jgi:hypothetical protein